MFEWIKEKLFGLKRKKNQSLGSSSYSYLYTGVPYYHPIHTPANDDSVQHQSNFPYSPSHDYTADHSSHSDSSSSDFSSSGGDFGSSDCGSSDCGGGGGCD